MNLTLEELFGVGSSQTSDSLIIQKSALLGLNPSASNTAESLLAAIIFTGCQVFQGVVTCLDGSNLTDPQGNSITFDNSNLYDFLNIFQWNRTYVDNFIVDTFVIETFELYMQIGQFPLITTLGDDDLILIQTASDSAYKSASVATLKSYIGLNSGSSSAGTGSNSSSGSNSTGTGSSSSSGTGSSGSSFIVLPFDTGFTNTTAQYKFSTVGSPIISTAQSKFGGSSMYLDGNSYIFYPLDDFFTFGSGSLTFSSWIYCTDDVSGANNMTIMGDAHQGGPDNYGLFLCINQGLLTFRHWVNGNTSAVHPTPVSPNTWHHVACTKSGTALNVFLDGNMGSPGNTSLVNSDGQFNIGAVPENAGYATNFKGYIDSSTIFKEFVAYTANFNVPTQTP